MKRSTIGTLATVTIVLGGLFLLTEQTAQNKHLALPQRCVGKLLVWSVKAGISRTRVKQIFGEPEVSSGFTSGPIDEEAHTSTFDTYLRFGVEVIYHSGPGSTPEGGEQMEYERIEGGIG